MPTDAHATARALAKTTVADCTHFRTWDGNAWDQATALSHVYLQALPNPDSEAAEHTRAQLEAFRPYCLIRTVPGGSLWTPTARSTAGGAYKWDPSGQLELEFVRDANVGEEELGTLIEAVMAEIGLIVQSDEPTDDTLLTLFGSAGYLDVHQPFGIDVPNGPMPGGVVAQGNFASVSILLSWGGTR